MSVIKSIHIEMYGHIMDLSIFKVVLLSFVYIDTHAIPVGCAITVRIVLIFVEYNTCNVMVQDKENLFTTSVLCFQLQEVQ